MRKLFFFLATSAFAATYGTGPSVAWFSDAAYTQPVKGAQQTQVLYGVLSAPLASATQWGKFAGSISTIDNLHIKYTAPAQVTPVSSLYGLQPLPDADIFYERVDALPIASTHYVGDGSGFCEGAQNLNNVFCGGDPIKGTGSYALLGPPGSTCPPGYTAAPGGSNDCHVGMSQLYIGADSDGSVTLVDGTFPLTKTYKNLYGSFTVTNYPDTNYRFAENRQNGDYSNKVYGCNSLGAMGALDYPNPPFAGCTPGQNYPGNNVQGTPFPNGYQSDYHIFDIVPATGQTFEVYGDLRFNSVMGCQDGTLTCNVSSTRSLDWENYSAVSSQSAGGTPVVANALTGEDLWRAAQGQPIQHDISYATAYHCAQGAQGNVMIWPSIGTMSCASGAISSYNGALLNGARKRLSSTRVDMTGALTISAVNRGSGYTPGTALVGTISGCAALDWVHPASAIAWIGANGSLFQNYLYITNTGGGCVNPTVTFPASPTVGGQTLTATVGTIKWDTGALGNVEQQLFARDKNYGLEMNDIGNAADAFRLEGGVLSSPYLSAYNKYYSTLGGNPYLWDAVDVRPLAPQASDGWPANMTKISWLADPANATEGSTLQNAAVVKLVGVDGKVSFTAIPLLGVGVGFNIGNVMGDLPIVSGMTAYDLTQHTYVVGDPSNAGVTYTWLTDPCPGADTLTPAGLYTACPQFDGDKKQGQIKATANANPNAFTIIQVKVLAVGADGAIRLDVGGPGGWTGKTPGVYQYTAGQWGSSTNGHNWMSDFPYGSNSVTHQTPNYYASGAGDYPRWIYAACPSPAAPLSTTSEGCGPNNGSNPLGNSIYASFYSAPELTWAIVVRNGNYSTRIMSGSPSGSTGRHFEQKMPLYSHAGPSTVIDTQDNVKYWAYCFPCANNWQQQMPSDLSVPAKVVDNVLKIGVRTYNPSHWEGQTPGSYSNQNGMPIEVSGLVISPDNTTQSHWEIGSYVPNANGADVPGDHFLVQPNNGSTNTWSGAIPPGVLQLYVRSWFAADPPNATTKVPTPDVQWSILSGPGSISATGLYVAPTAAQPVTNCATVQAQSISQPGIVTTQNVCVQGASYAFK